MFLSGHYAGQDLVPKFRGGQPWKKVFGPVYIYLNSSSIGDDPLWLWEDAKIQVCICSTFLFGGRWYSTVGCRSCKIKTDLN